MANHSPTRSVLHSLMLVCMYGYDVGGAIGQVVASIGWGTGVYHCTIWRTVMYFKDCIDTCIDHFGG